MPLSSRLAAFYFAHFAHVAVVVAYFPLYLAARGLRPAEIAWVLAIPQLARIFAPAGWGWLADHTGAQRGIVLAACAAGAAGFAALPWAGGLAEIALIVALMSLVSAAALPLVEALALGALGASGRYGPVRVWGSIGFIAVVLAGGAWLDARPATGVPGFAAAFAAAAALAAIALPRAGAHARPAPGPWRFPPGAGALLGSGFCMAIAHGALYAFLTLHLQRQGHSATVIGLLWTLGVVAEIAVFLFLPALLRRFSLAAILMASLACAVARFLAIGWGAEWLWLLVPAQLLHGATFGAFHAAAVAAVHRVFPAGAAARGQALYSSTGYGAGGAAGALAAGWAWELAGPGAAFSLGAAAAAAGLLLAYGLKRAGL